LIRIEITDSPGRSGEELFDNFKPQKSYKEQYMCVETGIYSGYVYKLGKDVFATKQDAEKSIDQKEE